MLVISRPEEITADDLLIGLSITTTFPDPPNRNEVQIPWHREGLAATGLRRRSAVVCDWLVSFQMSEIVAVRGYLPAANLIEVLRVHQDLAG